MAGMTVRIETLPDVIVTGQPAGLVQVIVDDFGTVVDLVVSDGTSKTAVYLDWQMVASLMMALGGCASQIPES